MSEGDFWDMTPRAYFLKYEGFIELEDNRRHDTWERERFFTVAIMNMWVGKGQKITPQKLCLFPWEKNIKKGGTIEKPKRDVERFKYWAKKWGAKLPEEIIGEQDS